MAGPAVHGMLRVYDQVARRLDRLRRGAAFAEETA